MAPRRSRSSCGSSPLLHPHNRFSRPAVAPVEEHALRPAHLRHRREHGRFRTGRDQHAAPSHPRFTFFPLSWRALPELSTCSRQGRATSLHLAPSWSFSPSRRSSSAGQASWAARGGCWRGRRRAPPQSAGERAEPFRRGALLPLHRRRAHPHRGGRHRPALPGFLKRKERHMTLQSGITSSSVSVGRCIFFIIELVFFSLLSRVFCAERYPDRPVL